MSQQQQAPKLFKVYDEKDRMIGHISAMSDGEALEKAKKRNPQAVKVGPHTGGIPQPAPAKEAEKSDGKDDEKKKDAKK